jgi:ATP-binding cassette subfamily F protein 3
MGEELAKTGDEKLANDYADLLHEMDVLDGYNIHHKTEEILQGLGFTNEELQKPYKNFSGGWRMRVLLAKMILQHPDVLLLDEPTNHLDMPSIEWLEKYLLHYQGSVVIVSHDRFFLDRMTNKIVELYQQQLHFYTGNYSYYEKEKEIRIDMQKKAFENQQDYIRQQERFVERFKAKASKAAQAQSIVKRLDKLERIEDVEIERPNMRINFAVERQPGKIICTLKNITKKFKEVQIVENTGAEIDRGDKIALIGANGKGKSTLLRIIAGTETFEGENKSKRIYNRERSEFGKRTGLAYSFPDWSSLSDESKKLYASINKVDSPLELDMAFRAVKKQIQKEKLEESSKEYTAFVTQDGIFRIQ